MARKSPKHATPARKTTAASAKPKIAARPRVAKQQPAPATTKAAQVLAALQQPGGATMADLLQVTGWQAHSVRGFLSGTVRKKLALSLVTEGKGSARSYRITGPAAVAKGAA